MTDSFVSCSGQYLDLALQFITEFRWLHDFKLTRFYTDRIYERAPEDWLDAFFLVAEKDFQAEMDLLWFADDFPPEYEWKLPESLRSFIARARNLCLERDLARYLDTLTPSRREKVGFCYNSSGLDCKIENRLKYGMVPKKEHEVARLAQLIGALCRQHGIQSVVDLGSGLGYLDCVLHEVFDLNVLAVESEEARTAAAEKRAKKWLKSKGSSRIFHKTLRISNDESSRQNLSNLIQSCDLGKTCIIGLHCCGDLTPSFLDLFASIPECQAMICVGCCYHLMELNNDHSGFNHFPLSNLAKSSMARFWKSSEPLLTVASLRLASQETRIKWMNEIDSYAYGHSYRAILEYVAEEEGFRIQKAKRHTPVTEFGSNFELFLQSVFTNYKVIGCSDEASFLVKLREGFEKFEREFPKVRLFRLLQGLVQGVLESFIAIDRYLYLAKDLKVDFAEVIPIFDESLSPRNLALVAIKEAKD